VPAPAIRQPKKRAFLAAYARLGTVRSAALAAHVARDTHYEWLRTDPEYAAAFEQAKDDAADLLEEIALERARGFDVVAHDEHGNVLRDERGEPIVVRRGSDTLLIFTLKALRPDKFRDNARVELAGQVAVASAGDLDGELRGFFAGLAAGRAEAVELADG
jgi:hypothetical protein